MTSALVHRRDKGRAHKSGSQDAQYCHLPSCQCVISALKRELWLVVSESSSFKSVARENDGFLPEFFFCESRQISF